MLGHGVGNGPGGNAKAWVGVVCSGVGGAWEWDAVRGKTESWQGLGY